MSVSKSSPRPSVAHVVSQQGLQSHQVAQESNAGEGDFLVFPGDGDAPVDIEQPQGAEPQPAWSEQLLQGLRHTGQSMANTIQHAIEPVRDAGAAVSQFRRTRHCTVGAVACCASTVCIAGAVGLVAWAAKGYHATADVKLTAR